MLGTTGDVLVMYADVLKDRSANRVSMRDGDRSLLFTEPDNLFGVATSLSARLSLSYRHQCASYEPRFCSPLT